MKLLTILTALSASFGAALAADICRPTGSDCFGTAACCSDIEEGKCCSFGAATARIMMIVPAKSRSKAWTGSGCTGNVRIDQNRVARKVCFTYPSTRLSGKWLTGLSSRGHRDAEVGECAEPNAVLQVRDGVTRRINLSEGMSVEDALAARDAGVVEAIPYVGEYETVNDEA